eukprot:scaffold21395_cov113-Isochrysis_galbana.AAC.8
MGVGAGLDEFLPAFAQRVEVLHVEDAQGVGRKLTHPERIGFFRHEAVEYDNRWLGSLENRGEELGPVRATFMHRDA